MTETVAEGKASAADQWRERIAEQQRSGASIKQFCKERGLAEHSFYAWRRRLRGPEPVRFAVVEHSPGRESAMNACVELLLPSGERLRIAAGVDGATLRTVLEALRA